jgi:hypothetical protein
MDNRTWLRALMREYRGALRLRPEDADRILAHIRSLAADLGAEGRALLAEAGLDLDDRPVPSSHRETTTRRRR